MVSDAYKKLPEVTFLFIQLPDLSDLVGETHLMPDTFDAGLLVLGITFL